MKRQGLLAAVLAGLIGAAGCGGGYSKVEGTVQYEDGRPVPGATVVFVPVGGAGMSPSGYTDASGHFTLKTGNAEGARKGKYKVLVTRSAKASDPPMEPGSPDAVKAMKKNVKKGGLPRKGPPPAGASSDNELEARYAAADQTPLSAEIPPAGALTFTVKAKKAGSKQ
jgi:hypothetical protein